MYPLGTVGRCGASLGRFYGNGFERHIGQPTAGAEL